MLTLLMLEIPPWTKLKVLRTFYISSYIFVRILDYVDIIYLLILVPRVFTRGRVFDCDSICFFVFYSHG